MAENLKRIRAIMALFGLKATQVAKAGGVSLPYLSRALGGTLTPSPAFYRRLEGNLGQLIEGRNAQYFQIPVTACEEAIEEVLRTPKEAGQWKRSSSS